VVVHYNQDEAGALNTAAQVREAGGRVAIVQANLLKSADAEQLVAKTVAEFGQLHIVVHSAGGIKQRIAAHETPDDVWDYIINVNLKSTFLISKHAFAHLAAAGPAGRLINVSSAAAYQGGRGGDGVYSAAKAGVNSLTKAFAKELSPYRDARGQPAGDHRDVQAETSPWVR
jgi:3-oxoacyl-[acyl-carrier protein] reductase